MGNTGHQGFQFFVLQLRAGAGTHQSIDERDEYSAESRHIADDIDMALSTPLP